MSTTELPLKLLPTDYIPDETKCGHNEPRLVKVWESHGTLFPDGQRWLQFKCRRWWCRWRGNYPADFGTWFGGES